MKKLIALIALLIPSLSPAVVHIGQGDNVTLGSITSSSVTLSGHNQTDSTNFDVLKASATSSGAANSSSAGRFTCTGTGGGGANCIGARANVSYDSATGNAIGFDSNIIGVGKNVAFRASASGGAENHAISITAGDIKQTLTNTVLAADSTGIIISTTVAASGSFVNLGATLQSGATFYVSSGTVSNLNVNLIGFKNTSGNFISAIQDSGTGANGNLLFGVTEFTGPMTLDSTLAIVGNTNGRTFAFVGPTPSTVTYGLSVGSLSVVGSGNGVIEITGSGAGEIDLTEGAAPSGIAGKDVIWADSSVNWPLFIPNNQVAPYFIMGSSASATLGHCAAFSGNGGSLVDSGAACGSGSGTGAVGIYPATGTASFPFGASISTVAIQQAGNTTPATASTYGLDIRPTGGPATLTIGADGTYGYIQSWQGALALNSYANGVTISGSTFTYQNGGRLDIKQINWPNGTIQLSSPPVNTSIYAATATASFPFGTSASTVAIQQAGNTTPATASTYGLDIRPNGGPATFSLGVDGTNGYIQSWQGSVIINQAGNSILLAPTNGGFVAIGTTTPAYQLDVVGGVRVSSYILVNQGSNLVGPINDATTYPLRIQKSGTNELMMGLDNSYGYLQTFNSKPLQINNLGNNVLLNLTSGNVGISTGIPQANLDVEGAGGIKSGFGVVAATLTATSGVAFTQTYKAALCQSGTASLGFSAFSSSAPAVSCVASSSTVMGIASFVEPSTSSVQDHFTLPTDWTGAVSASIVWNSTATSNSVVWQLRTGCAADAENPTVTWNAFATVTDATKGTASQLNTTSITAIPTTNCSAGEEMFFEFLRDSTNASDTLASTANLVTLQVVIRRTLAL